MYSIPKSSSSGYYKLHKRSKGKTINYKHHQFNKQGHFSLQLPKSNSVLPRPIKITYELSFKNFTIEFITAGTFSLVKWLKIIY